MFSSLLCFSITSPEVCLCNYHLLFIENVFLTDSGVLCACGGAYYDSPAAGAPYTKWRDCIKELRQPLKNAFMFSNPAL